MNPRYRAGGGRHVRDCPIARQFAEARKQVKIPKDMVFYSERRFVAADLLDRTGKIAPAGKMLRRESPGAMMRYAHPE